ncbi:MAG: YhjD/YihY/BrkB family envelope integrity protein [Trueperaceae bacterium]|nr:YhjD/YihY/BrkB family envelope integrity protein [Trueperaceae bacterium]
MPGRLAAWSTTPAGRFAMGLGRRYARARVPLLAAALAYYATFALGPLLLLLGGWLALALRASPELAAPYRAALVDLVGQLLPLEMEPQALVDASFTAIVSQLGEGAVLRSVLSVLVLLWASSAFLASLQIALELIFDVRRPRGFLRKRAVGLLLVVAAAAFVVVEVVGGALGGAAAQAWARLREVAGGYDLTLPDLRLPAAFDLVRAAGATAVFALAFRYLPRRGSDAVGAWIGAAACTVSLVATRQVLLSSLSFERVNLVYGAVTGIVVVLLWLYAALWLFLMGAVIAAEVTRVRRLAARAARLPRTLGRDPDAAT